MPRPCTVCTHDKHSVINADLHTGTPASTVAQTYGLGRMAVQRHRADHMSEAWAHLTPEQVENVTAIADIDAELSGLLADLRLARNTAVNRDTGYVNIPHLDKVAGRIVQAVELVAKLERRLGPNTVVDARQVTVNLAQSDEWQRVRRSIVDALRSHPAALADVSDALGQLEAGDGAVDVEAVAVSR